MVVVVVVAAEEEAIVAVEAIVEGVAVEVEVAEVEEEEHPLPQRCSGKSRAHPVYSN